MKPLKIWGDETSGDGLDGPGWWLDGSEANNKAVLGNCETGEPATFGNDWMATKNRLMTSGETDGIQERTETKAWRTCTPTWRLWKRAIRRENTLRVFREGGGWKTTPWWPTGNELVQSTLRGTIVTTTENIWKCGKVCKILRVLKIRQAKIKCGIEKRQENRTAVSDQTEEDQHYRTEDLQPNVSSQEDKSEANEGQRVYQETLLANAKDKIKWPLMISEEWGSLMTTWRKFSKWHLHWYLLRNNDKDKIYTIAENRYGAEENSSPSH